MWRGQNRRTGMVGFFPSEYANLKHNIISGWYVLNVKCQTMQFKIMPEYYCVEILI